MADGGNPYANLIFEDKKCVGVRFKLEFNFGHFKGTVPCKTGDSPGMSRI